MLYLAAVHQRPKNYCVYFFMMNKERKQLDELLFRVDRGKENCPFSFQTEPEILKITTVV